MQGSPDPWALIGVLVALLTQVKMEKKEKVMAARAASAPSFSGLFCRSETCHWLARKQKPTNQRNAQKAGRGHHQNKRERDRLWVNNKHITFLQQLLSYKIP